MRQKSLGVPISIQMELAEGCSRLCPFCGLNGIRKAPGNYKFLSKETAQAAAEQCADLCPKARYEFAMHGEPLMHAQADELISLFRGLMPEAQIQVTTNGKVLMGRMQQRLDRLFEIGGINFVILDTYLPERDKLREEASRLQNYEVVDFYEDLAPKGISPWHNHGMAWQRKIILMDDLGLRDGEVGSRKILNHAGNVSYKNAVPLDQPLEKTCTNPFREASICWNGNVNICCMDWGHEYVCGNITETSLRDIWFGAKFEAARAILQQKKRPMSPCVKCNKNSGARSGLLPLYQAPTPEQIDLAENTVQVANPINDGKKIFLREIL